MYSDETQQEIHQTVAMKVARAEMERYSREDLMQYFFDRRVDELIDEPLGVLEAMLQAEHFIREAGDVPREEPT